MTELSRTEPRFVAHPAQPAAAIEIAVYTLGRRALLTRDPWLEALAESVDRALVSRRLALYAFVFLPDQARLLIAPPGPNARLPWIAFAIKRTVSQAIRRDLRETRSELLRELTVGLGRGRYVFQPWEPGPARIIERDSANRVLESIDSIHGAPVARGLCETSEAWRWSSWRSYHDSKAGPVETCPYVTPWGSAYQAAALETQDACTT